MSDADRLTWDARYRERAGEGEPMTAPSGLVTSLDALLPRQGRALDIAGGTGRHALWLARRGLDVTLADISEVALDLAGRAAAREGVQLERLAIDLEREPLPNGPWDVILSVYFLERRLFEAYPLVLAPGGCLVVVHPTRSNLLRHERPSARYLLEDGELPGLIVARGALEILLQEEGWLDGERHEARVVARKRV